MLASGLVSVVRLPSVEICQELLNLDGVMGARGWLSRLDTVSLAARQDKKSTGLPPRSSRIPSPCVEWGRSPATGGATSSSIEGLLSGESAVRPLTGFAPYFENDVAWAAPISDDGNPSDGSSTFSQAVRHAAREAVHNALEDRGWRPGRVVGVIHGLVLGDVRAWREFHHRKGFHTSKRQILQLMPSTVLTAINREFDFHGPTMSVTAMCASGVAGILTAKMWIDAGIVDDVLVLTSDMSITPDGAAAFAQVGVMIMDGPSMDVCRPFQEGSRGFTAGEASVGFILSRAAPAAPTPRCSAGP